MSPVLRHSAPPVLPCLFVQTLRWGRASRGKSVDGFKARKECFCRDFLEDHVKTPDVVWKCHQMPDSYVLFLHRILPVTKQHDPSAIFSLFSWRPSQIDVSSLTSRVPPPPPCPTLSAMRQAMRRSPSPPSAEVMRRTRRWTWTTTGTPCRRTPRGAIR